MPLIHTRRQNPIGQGFFHSGTLNLAGYPFRYVYDCGSEDRDALSREVRAFVRDAGSDTLDILFLSHLDADHVCGLSQLLALTNVSCVVLPYLTAVERLLILSQSLEQGTVDGTEVNFLADPARWLAGRGVSLVIYILPAEENDGGGGTAPPGGPSDSPNVTDDRFILDDKSESIALDIDALRSNAHSAVRLLDAELLFVSCRDPLSLRIAKGLLNWQFLTFVHPEREREALFRQEVERTFGARLFSHTSDEFNYDRVLEILRNSDSRHQLGICYRLIRRNRNLTSLSLYSGPASPKGFRIDGAATDGQLVNVGRVAWLGTGDANLNSDVRRRAFLRHYSDMTELVGTFALPHHGAQTNFHPELLQFRGPVVAAAGSESRYGHPHPRVKSLVGTRRLVTVTERPESAFSQKVVLQEE